MHACAWPWQISEKGALRTIPRTTDLYYHFGMDYTPLNRLVVLLLAVLLILFGALAVFQPPTRHYAYMIIEAPENLGITFLLNGRGRAADCEATIASLASAMLASCPTCRIKQLQCLMELDSAQQRLHSGEPLDTPSARLPGGVASYAAPNPATALAACRESQRPPPRAPRQ